MTKKEQCGEPLAFDCSDPAGGCVRDKGHEGPHVLEDGTEFTDEDNATCRLKATRDFAKITGLSFEAACGHMNIDKQGNIKRG